MKSLSVVLPTYNEIENLKILLPKLNEMFTNLRIDFEIIVVDDDSPDGSWMYIQETYKDDLKIHSIRRINEKGLSSAILSGMAQTKNESILVMDADMQHDETIIPKLLKEIENFDVVIGSRLIENGSYGEMSQVRIYLSKLANWLTKKIISIETTDPMSGFFLINREIFEKTKNKINPIGFKILLEFLYYNPNAKIKEVGYTFRKRKLGDTKFNSKIMREFLLGLYELRLGKYISTQFIKYSLVGSVGVFVNSGSFFLFYYLFQGMLNIRYLELTSFLLSVFSNYHLNNIWTFNHSRIVNILNHLKGFSKFLLISLIGYFLQISVIYFFYFKITGSYLEKYSYFPYNMIGIIMVTATNYYLNKEFTWRKR